MSADNSNIHRLLDEAFAGVAVTPELQDLKEELRGNLSARVGELVEHGTEPSAAATIAVNELGDIRELIDQVEAGEREPTDAGTPARSKLTTDWATAQQLNRVRPKPAYIIRTVVLSVLFVVAAFVVGLGALRHLDWPTCLLLGLVAALSGGAILADALQQETSQHYPLPVARAVFYGASAALGFIGIVAIALYMVDAAPLGVLVGGGVLALAAIIGFIWLGTTQTNRAKPWVRTLQRQYAAGDRFSQDPVAAARFGIYTAVIWILAFAAFIVLSATTGFAWSWLVFPLGFAIFMLVLARMLFPADSKKERKDDRTDR
jgi:hypothetical protein